MVKCPICGDPGPFVLWVDKRPPVECPYGPEVKAVTDCPHQMQKARDDADRRRLCPERFDKRGNIIPAMAGKVLETFYRHRAKGAEIE